MLVIFALLALSVGPVPAVLISNVQMPFPPGANVQMPFQPGANVQMPFQPGANVQMPFQPGANVQMPFQPGANVQMPFQPGSNGQMPNPRAYNHESTPQPESKPHKPHQPKPLSTEPCTEQEVNDKDVDLLVYGATGFTGRLAALYLAGHPAKPRFAIGGRDYAKLKYIKSLADPISPRPIDMFQFGMKNQSRMSQFVTRARAIVNFAGPYESNNGEALIREAIRSCAHYIDISTETHWKATILKKYATTAEARGVAVVQSAGFASAASDFLAMSAITDVMEAQKEPPSNVMVVWTKFNEGTSGGQKETMKYELMHHGPISDAYILAPDTAVNQKVDWKVDGMEDYGYHDGLGMLRESTMALTDCPVIRRSIKAQLPDASISVQMAVNASVANERLKFLQNDFSSTEPAVKADPVPGQGPPMWVQRDGSFAGVAIASGRWSAELGKSTFHKARVTVEGHGDPSFAGSARMATELALGLVNKPNKGYLTPSSALGARNLEECFKQVDAGKFIQVTHG